MKEIPDLIAHSLSEVLCILLLFMYVAYFGFVFYVHNVNNLFGKINSPVICRNCCPSFLTATSVFIVSCLGKDRIAVLRGTLELLSSDRRTPVSQQRFAS